LRAEKALAFQSGGGGLLAQADKSRMAAISVNAVFMAI
jgi:hypothetical protein